MVLFDDIIEIFDAADFDVRFMLRIVAFDRCRVGAALVDRDLLRLAMLPASKGAYLTTQRLSVEWSTATPRSSSLPRADDSSSDTPHTSGRPTGSRRVQNGFP
jgi:hypothetical protein